MSSYIPIYRQISDRLGNWMCSTLHLMVCRNYSVRSYLHCSNRTYHLRPSFHDAHSLQKTAVSIITHSPNVSNYKMTIFPASFTGQPPSVRPSRCCPISIPVSFHSLLGDNSTCNVGIHHSLHHIRSACTVIHTGGASFTSRE